MPTDWWMDKEDVVLSHKKWNLAICNDVAADGNKSVRERQITYDFTHIWSLRNKTNKRKKKREEGKPRNRGVLAIKSKLMVTRGEVGGGWIKQVMAIKACAWDEHPLLYESVESLYCTLEINITLYVNLVDFKLKLKKRKKYINCRKRDS